MMINERRIYPLNQAPHAAGPVVYWMSREQRVADNWGLYHAQQLALERKVPLLVAFTLADGFLGATLRQYSFMLQGLAEVAARLRELQIPFVLLHGEPEAAMAGFVAQQQVGCVVVDFDPLRIKRQWFEGLAAAVAVAVIEVDGHNVVPCRLASSKREYGAYTLRPKLRRLWPEFLTELPRVLAHPFAWQGQVPLFDSSALLSRLALDRSVGELAAPAPGEKAVAAALADFLQHRLSGYAVQRNNPVVDGQSGLSSWLHFGQLAPQRVALAVAAQGDTDDAAALLEELLVRRELADNFCLHCPEYDTLDAAPGWARATLEKHRHDPRQFCYSAAEFQQAATHDPLWNAAQQELLLTGRMHGYLRMYWAKKILEWSESPEAAMAIAVQLNDRYALDGRDPNGYAGIAWSICGVHDRAWAERPVFGSIRCMSLAGCRRKFEVQAFIDRMHQCLSRQSGRYPDSGCSEYEGK